jgi:2,4-dienoyl-CoA reductase-like NADH-dependent reductase (Old Yellow Enzyme family)
VHAIHDPLSLPCGLTVAGRVALAPLTNTQSHSDGSLGNDELRWLRMRAEGGFSWVSTCAAFVSDEGKAWDGQLGIASDRHVAGLERLAAALSSAGTVAVVQLHHAGAKASLAPDRPLTTVDGDSGGPRGATPDDIHRVTADFVSAARRAEEAGFSGVEIDR